MTQPVTLLLVVRYAAFAAFAVAVLFAFGSWLVRTQRISPFTAIGRALRQATDPVLRPLERRVVRAGGTPAQAGFWLVIVVAVVGVLGVSLVQWLVGAWYAMAAAARGGRRDQVALILEFVFDLLFAAIFVRVVASWLGAFRYSRWMRPVYWLTDWIIEPIRRVLPRTGLIDLSPLVALLLLWLLKQVVIR